MSDETPNSAVEATTLDPREMWQMSAFPEHAPDVPAEAPRRRSAASEGRPVPRSPGWRLVASGGAVAGWHRIKSVGARSEVRTICGLRGRAVIDESSSIVECAACQAGSP